MKNETKPLIQTISEENTSGVFVEKTDDQKAILQIMVENH